MEAIIKLNFSAEQLNTILVALAQLPYHQVNELINMIQKESSPQLMDAKARQNQSTVESVKQVNAN